MIGDICILMLRFCYFLSVCRDATFITASGSIIAAAGYSSTGVNVVMWDTLAPPATSQASIMCHEGLSPLLILIASSLRTFYIESDFGRTAEKS